MTADEVVRGIAEKLRVADLEVDPMTVPDFERILREIGLVELLAAAEACIVNIEERTKEEDRYWSAAAALEQRVR
jgi:hypothetical protein